MNVVTYCRVSSDEQAQKDLSIPAQRKMLNRWVDDHANCSLVEEFVDEGESAFAPANKRPGFSSMIAYCKRMRPIDAPDLDVPLHVLIKLTPNAYGCEEQRHVLGPGSGH